jgi:Asp/Glu/hydantoin racemase
VLGLGEASMLYGCQLGQRLGIVTINPRFIPGFRHQITKYGLEKRVTGVHAISFEPGQLLAAYDSPELYRRVHQLFIDQARPLVAEGVEVVIPGGGIPMLLFAGEKGFAIDGAPVVNGIPIVVKMAEMAVKLRRLSGIGPSRAADFVKPPPEIIEEFLAYPKNA